MLLHALLLAAPLHAPAVAPQEPADRRAQVRARYVELADARDADGLRALWRDNVDLIVATFDADLEGSLALWEKSPEAPDEDAIEALEQRALFAARVATRETGLELLADYASAFVGWNADDKRNFRTGQAVYGRAMKELKDGDHEEAAMAARECHERALPLGDWWGVAMGWGAEARAQRAGGHMEAALACYSNARLYYGQLGMRGEEYRNLQGMVAMLRNLERLPRAIVAARTAATMARALGDADGEREMLVALADAQRLGGDEEAALATEAELEELEGR